VTGEKPSADAWRKHWAMCCQRASEAGGRFLYAREDERQMGALTEAGCALGAGKQVYLVK
jgi:hypothetical protein